MTVVRRSISTHAPPRSIGTSRSDAMVPPSPPSQAAPSRVTPAEVTLPGTSPARVSTATRTITAAIGTRAGGTRAGRTVWMKNPAASTYPVTRSGATPRTASSA
jgi:hypothetical protein